MNPRSDKEVLLKVQRLLAPYARESLSAFDNMKLVVSVISADAKKRADDSVKPEPGIAYEVTQHRDNDVEIKDDKGKLSESFYCIKWQNIWINCGLSDNYSSSIQLLTHDGKVLQIKEPVISDGIGEDAIGVGVLDILNIDTASLREMNVPVLSLQQIEFMCMDYAHFDHC